MELVGLARPYAKAAFAVAYEGEQFDKWNKNFQILVYLVQQQVVIKYLTNPNHTSLQKADKLIELSDSEFCSKFQKFIHIVADANRLLLIESIYSFFVHLLREQQHILHVCLRTAYKLDAVQQDKISQKLLTAFNKKLIDIKHIVDEGLLGGVIIKIGDLELDYSVRGRIDKMRSQIVS